MDKKSGRRWRSAAGLALAMALAGPAVVQAQLLPNLPTRKRERPPCAAEPPFFSAVRHQYFGYYPTCWRKFPPGWACPCPNPELPDFQRSLRERPLKAGDDAAGSEPRDTTTGDPFESRDRTNRPGAAPGPGPDSALPPMPNEERSPFDVRPGPRPAEPPPLDDTPAPGRDRPAPDRRVPAPRTEAAPKPADAETLEMPAPAAAATPSPAAPSPAGSVPTAAAVASSRRLELPPVAEAAAEVPPLVQSEPASAVEPAPAEDAASGSPSMPSTPAPSLPAPVLAGSPADATPVPAPLSPNAQAPTRRGPIGGLLNRMRRR